jgi:hypothetical protein
MRVLEMITVCPCLGEMGDCFFFLHAILISGKIYDIAWLGFMFALVLALLQD